MCRRGWNKTIVVSLSLAAAGIITCIAALLESVAPKESVVSFLAVKCALGVVIIAVMVGFAWICDKCEDYFSGRIERLLDPKQQKSRGTANEEEDERSVPHETDFRFAARQLPGPNVPLSRYVGGLRGSARPNADSAYAAFLGKRWHGQ